MRTRLAVTLLVVAMMAGVVAVILAIAPRGMGPVPMTSPPAASPAPSDPQATAAPMEAERLENIDGVPVHITVRSQDATLVDAGVVPTQLDHRGWLSPEAGRAGWYGPPQWQTVPGDLSEYRAVIAGHNVTGTGRKDVFFDLGKARAGDSVLITFALRSGGQATAEFAVDSDAVTAAKGDVISLAESTYRWAWRTEAPQRTVVLFTCDLDAPHINGHSVDNWVVTATRTS